MRFAQLDGEFKQYEWSNTVDSYNKKIGLHAFVDFDYSNFTNSELSFLKSIIDLNYTTVFPDHIESMLIPGYPIEHRRWYWVDSVLNFAPTNDEILKSMSGEFDTLRNTPIAKKQLSIIKDQLKDILGNEAPTSGLPTFNSIISTMGSKTDPIVAANIFNTLLNLPEYMRTVYPRSEGSSYLFGGEDNIATSDIITAAVMRDVNEYTSFYKVDQFDLFLYNAIAGIVPGQIPYYMLWLAAHPDQKYREFAAEYGVGIVKNTDQRKLPQIIVGSRYRKLLSLNQKNPPDISAEDVIPNSSFIQIPGLKVSGIPIPSIQEKLFYLRLFHGIAAAHDEKYDTETDETFVTKYHPVTKTISYGVSKRLTQLKDMPDKFPFRMRYDIQFLLPEIWYNRNIDSPDNPPKENERYSVRLESANFHFVFSNKSPVYEIKDPINNSSYDREDIDYWYFGLWCHAVDDNASVRKYYPTGFRLPSETVYNVFATHTTPNRAIPFPFNNYTSFGLTYETDDPDERKKLFQKNTIDNVTYWFNSQTINVDKFDNYTPNGTKMNQPGPRSGIPTHYLSILKIQTEIRGRELILEAENFAKVIQQGIANKEILPVSYELEGKFIDITDTYRDSKTKLVIQNETFKRIAQNETKKLSVENNRIVERPNTNPQQTAYISNISKIEKTHPHFKYHQRPWNKTGTGVYAKFGDIFSPGTWIEFFTGNHPLNKCFSDNTYQTDFPADVLDDTVKRNLCDPIKQMMYPRTLIEPDFDSVFRKAWIDTHPLDGNNLLNLEHRLYLTVMHASVSIFKHGYHTGLINGEFGLQATDGFTVSNSQRAVADQLLYGYYFDGTEILDAKSAFQMLVGNNNSASRNFWYGATKLTIDVLNLKSTEQVYWGLNAVTAISQLSNSVISKIIEVAYGNTAVGTVLARFGVSNGAFYRLSQVDTFMYGTLYSKYFKYGSTAYKIIADFNSAVKKQTWQSWTKFVATLVNAYVSIDLLSYEKVASTLKLIGIGKNTAGWIVTGIFLVINEALDASELSDKRDKVENLFREANRLGLIEGPYVQSGGVIKISKSSLGELPVAYNNNGNPVEWESVQSESKDKIEDSVITSYEELMGEKGQHLFWRHLTCEDAKELKRILESDQLSYGTYGSLGEGTSPGPAPRIADVAPNHFDYGIHTKNKNQSFDATTTLFYFGPLGQYDQLVIQEDVPYTNASLLKQWYLPKSDSFIPTFKYTRDSDSITLFDSLSKYFNGSEKTLKTEFGIKADKGILSTLNITDMGIRKVELALGSTITDKEKIYLIRKKYNLHLVNPTFGKGCCQMRELIEELSDFIRLNWPNDGIVKNEWVDWVDLPSNSPKRKSLTRYKNVAGAGEEIQGCEYRITLSTPEVYARVSEIANCSCFSGETEVNTPTGLRKISDIKIGDPIMSFDSFGNIHESVVNEVFHHTDFISKLFRYTLSNGNHLDITQNHPVLTDQGIFIEIGNLTVGDSLITENNEKTTIVDIQFLKNDFTYNISVDTYSTYIANGIRVHNKNKYLAAPTDRILPVTRYDDNINTYAEHLIQTDDIDEPEPDYDCITWGICNDVTCSTCDPIPRFIKVCSIPKLCMPPKYTNGVIGSLPTWLEEWIRYDFRTNWSDSLNAYSDYYSWWFFNSDPDNFLGTNRRILDSILPSILNFQRQICGCEEFNSRYWFPLPLNSFFTSNLDNPLAPSNRRRNRK